jgi:hypothetical protein
MPSRSARLGLERVPRFQEARLFGDRARIRYAASGSVPQAFSLAATLAYDQRRVPSPAGESP